MFRNASVCVRVCVCVCVCVGKSKHKREANLSDLIKHLEVLPLTYIEETGLSVWAAVFMSLSYFKKNLFHLKRNRD